ncbi:hypothetical protein [Bradyrhizobium sp. CCGUVB4N]|uniref:hypothetical protein n=1 Tax=Bradyrhizobium sp. CCGUVB4N TaxID=2949631 RepID=UPI0035C67E35
MLGVLIRSVDDVVQAMGMIGVCTSEVSRLCAEIDGKVKRYSPGGTRTTGRIGASTPTM